jgi:translation initiation factor 2 beta subunit (eIF-2beta)/eIF-5
MSKTVTEKITERLEEFTSGYYKITSYVRCSMCGQLNRITVKSSECLTCLYTCTNCGSEELFDLAHS